jgi:glycosyltransferase involved in cell wall biosynthesis
MPDVGVVGLVPDEWGGPWMPRHQVLTRLGRYFPVVWVNPARGWRDLWLPRHSTPRNYDLDTSSPPQGLNVYRPGKWLPELYRYHPLASYVAAQRLRNAIRILRDRGCKTIILYLWRPQFFYALRAVQHDLSCYHIDDEYTFSDTDRPIDPQEAALIRDVDQVIIHSIALMEKKGGLNPHTILVSNGVDFEAFASPMAEPKDMASIPHPRIGYVGVIKKQLDLDLLLRLARRHTEWSFVMVGPRGPLDADAAIFDALISCPNVWFLGRKTIDQLPAYAQHMDVCTMCYKLDDYTKYIYPLKMHEYLAGGRPVVATPIRSVEAFSQVIRLARTEDEWSQALAVCLTDAERSPQRAEERRRLARQHDWGTLVERIAGTLCERLGPAYAARFAAVAARTGDGLHAGA